MKPLYALQGGVYSGIKVFYASYGGERQVLVRLFNPVYTRQLAQICLWRFCEIGSLLLIGLLAIGTIAKAQAQLIAGQFAFQGQKAQTHGYLKVTSTPGAPLRKRLDLWMTESGKTQAIRSYQVEMT